MRMWMVDPAWMCKNHLLGEHKELHMLVGHMAAGRRLGRYLTNGLVHCDPTLIVCRHDSIVDEMRLRGWPSGQEHATPMDVDCVATVVPPDGFNLHLNVYANMNELLRRCAECTSRFWDNRKQ